MRAAAAQHDQRALSALSAAIEGAAERALAVAGPVRRGRRSTRAAIAVGGADADRPEAAVEECRAVRGSASQPSTTAAGSASPRATATARPPRSESELAVRVVVPERAAIPHGRAVRRAVAASASSAVSASHPAARAPGSRAPAPGRRRSARTERRADRLGGDPSAPVVCGALDPAATEADVPDPAATEPTTSVRRCSGRQCRGGRAGAAFGAAVLGAAVRPGAVQQRSTQHSSRTGRRRDGRRAGRRRPGRPGTALRRCGRGPGGRRAGAGRALRSAVPAHDHGGAVVGGAGRRGRRRIEADRRCRVPRPDTTGTASIRAVTA